MPKGNVNSGLLKAIIDLINEWGPEEGHFTSLVAKELVARGYWAPGQSQTPERTVNSYFCKNPEIFASSLPDMYFLREAYWKPGHRRGRTGRSAVEWADDLSRELTKELEHLPQGFHDSFK